MRIHCIYINSCHSTVHTHTYVYVSMYIYMHIHTQKAAMATLTKYASNSTHIHRAHTSQSLTKKTFVDHFVRCFAKHSPHTSPISDSYQNRDQDTRKDSSGGYYKWTKCKVTHTHCPQNRAGSPGFSVNELLYKCIVCYR